MSRSIRKANCGDHIDRISELPSNVIDVILQHLPIRDAVRTSILSKRWRYKWISVPQLEFGDDFFEECRYIGHIGNHEIPLIITEVLLIHNGPISKFTLEIPCDYPVRIKCLYKWIQFLSKSGIEDLVLWNQQTEPYQMPSHLFSCQGLTSLAFDNFELSLSLNFGGFKGLLELHMGYIRFESGGLESLISSCPVLNELTISFCSGFDSINVPAPSLKILYIEGGQVIKSICYEKAKNLIDLTIMHVPWENFDQLNVSDFIKGLPKIERLCLGEGFIKILSAGITPHTLLKKINSFKFLELDGVDFNLSKELFFIVCLLKSSPNLEELCIKSYSGAAAPEPDHLTAFDCNNCYLNELRKVNIEVKNAYEPAMDLIQFLLANSSSLKNLTFKVGFGLKKSDMPTLLRISRDLLQMERASRAQVQFLYEGLDE